MDEICLYCNGLILEGQRAKCKYCKSDYHKHCSPKSYQKNIGMHLEFVCPFCLWKRIADKCAVQIHDKKKYPRFLIYKRIKTSKKLKAKDENLPHLNKNCLRCNGQVLKKDEVKCLKCQCSFHYYCTPSLDLVSNHYAFECTNCSCITKLNGRMPKIKTNKSRFPKTESVSSLYNPYYAKLLKDKSCFHCYNFIMEKDKITCIGCDGVFHFYCTADPGKNDLNVEFKCPICSLTTLKQKKKGPRFLVKRGARQFRARKHEAMLIPLKNFKCEKEDKHSRPLPIEHILTEESKNEFLTNPSMLQIANVPLKIRNPVMDIVKKVAKAIGIHFDIDEILNVTMLFGCASPSNSNTHPPIMIYFVDDKRCKQWMFNYERKVNVISYGRIIYFDMLSSIMTRVLHQTAEGIGSRILC